MSEENIYLAHKNDCEVVESGDYKEMLDSEGDILFSVPKNITDKEIYRILHIANMAYRKGFDLGKYRAQQDVKKALGISP